MTRKTSQGTEGGRKDIVLSDDDVRDAKRLLSLLADIDKPSSQDSSGERLSRDRLVQRAEAVLANRTQRIRHFPRGIFGEPAWDMLLVLYTADGHAPETIRDLREMANLTHTTAGRWLDYLESKQLIERKPNPKDGRSAYVDLTTKAKESLDQYFSALIDTE